MSVEKWEPCEINILFMSYSCALTYGPLRLSCVFLDNYVPKYQMSSGPCGPIFLIDIKQNQFTCCFTFTRNKCTVFQVTIWSKFNGGHIPRFSQSRRYVKLTHVLGKNLKPENNQVGVMISHSCKLLSQIYKAQ